MSKDIDHDHMRIAVVMLDNPRFGSGPGTVLEVNRQTRSVQGRDAGARHWRPGGHVMKQNKVKIGGCYLTRIGGSLVAVKVLSETKDYWSGRTAFVVERVDNGRVLPKCRTAASLRTLVQRYVVARHRVTHHIHVWLVSDAPLEVKSPSSPYDKRGLVRAESEEQARSKAVAAWVASGPVAFSPPDVS